MMRTLLILLGLAIAVPAGAEDMRERAHVREKFVSIEDVKAEIEFGREVAARIIGKYGLYRNAEKTRYVNLVGKGLARYSNRPELEFTFGILDTKVVNAFAAPGGYVFITRGALDAMQNEAQLAGALAHEIIHVSEKHIVNELNIKGSETSMAAGMGRLIGGATDVAKVAFVKAVDQAVSILFERGYKQEDEIEADTLGVTLAASQGYQAAQYIDFLRFLDKRAARSATASLEKLHPSFTKRIAWVKNAVHEYGIEETGGKMLARRFHQHMQ